MSNVLAILGALVAILGIIVVHEWGHFIVARCVGIKVLRFSMGFGKPLWRYQGKKGTEYTIGWLPLGGYVKMLGEEAGQVLSPEEQAQAYTSKSVWARMAVVSAGPLINFLLAILLFWWVFSGGIQQIRPIIGEVRPGSAAAVAGLQSGDEILAINGDPVYGWQSVLMTFMRSIGDAQAIDLTLKNPDFPTGIVKPLLLADWHLDSNRVQPLEALGITPYEPKIPPILDNVAKDSPAAGAGLQVGDRIRVMNGQPLLDWFSLVKWVHEHPGATLSLVIERHQALLSLPALQIRTMKEQGQAYGYLGAGVQAWSWPSEMIRTLHLSPLAALQRSLQQTKNLISFNFHVIVKMFEGNISVRMLGGPISIFQSAGAASQEGLKAYLSFVAFVSVTLGFVNLLPIPGLDGGHLLFQLIELIRKRPVEVRWQEWSLRLGMLLLIFLMLQATFNDLMRL